MCRVLPLSILTLSALLSASNEARAQLKLKEREAVPLVPAMGGQNTSFTGFSPDGRWFAQARGDAKPDASGRSSIVVWDVATGKEATTLAVPLTGLTVMRWNATGTALAVSGRGAETNPEWAVVVWDMKTRKQAAVLRTAETQTLLSFNPDGTTLATRSDRGNVRLWELATGKERANFSVPGTVDNPRGDFGARPVLTYTPDGKMLVVVGRSGTFYFWDVESEQGRSNLAKSDSNQRHYTNGSFVFAPKTGDLLFSGSRHSTVTGRQVGDVPGAILTVSPDERVSIATRYENAKYLSSVFDTESKKPVSVLALDYQVLHAVFGADGKTLTVVTKDNVFQTWDLTWEKAPAK